MKGCIFVEHDFLELPFPDAHFDAAFSCYAIENMSIDRSIITHFFEKKDAGKLFQNLNLKILSITELVDESDKRRAHWVVLSEKQSQKKKKDSR